MQILTRNKIRDEREKSLYSFLLLFISFVNFAAFIPTLGGRFKLVFFLFATTYLFILFLHMKRSRVSVITIVGLFPMLLYAAVAFRTGATNMNAWIFTLVLSTTSYASFIGCPTSVSLNSTFHVFFNKEFIFNKKTG